MIFSEIKDWKDLQNKVCDLLNQSGFIAEKEKDVETPRGEMEIDVYAYDPNSIDKITYIVECKNWNKNVNQDVIHSFTTRMNETGGNLGYIISKKGFQKGAKKYIRSTNINLFTFQEIQSRYLSTWLSSFFCTKIRDYSDELTQYVEPINYRRNKFVDKLDKVNKKRFFLLYDKYELLGSYLTLIAANSKEVQKIYKTIGKNTELDVPSISKQKNFFLEHYKMEIKSDNYTDLLIELEPYIKSVTEEFHKIFNENIFSN